MWKTGTTIEVADKMLGQLESQFEQETLSIFDVPSSILGAKQVVIGRHKFLYISSKTGIAFFFQNKELSILKKNWSFYFQNSLLYVRL